MRHPKFSDRVFGVYTGVFLANGVYTGYIRLTAPRSQLYGPFENGEMCKLYARVRLYAYTRCYSEVLYYSQMRKVMIM